MEYSVFLFSTQALTLVDYPFPDFHPHGIALRSTPTGLTAYVVNHRVVGGDDSAGFSTFDSVSVFAVNVEEGTARFLSDKTSPAFRSINNLALLTDSDAFVTNYRYYNPVDPLALLETYLQLPWSYLLRCDLGDPAVTGEAACKIVADKIKMANGVEIDKAGEKVYVAGSLAKQLLPFELEGEALVPLPPVPLGQLPDNISWGNDDTLLIAGHPKAFKFMAHGLDPENVESPCQVDYYHVPDDALHTVHLSEKSVPKVNHPTGKGTPAISACTTMAVAGNGRSYVGSVYQRGILECHGYEANGEWDKGHRAKWGGGGGTE